ncbi:type II toxin-antitoxin system PemK/MazF family toxin [Nocardia alni]|uniref:type II toxin-antitoxin system PemK/MazF family toxin n=1 Tax=Nocardia alni TaxID=2815723 RepID=UPI001C23B890|nr:type II toxin-antitoxin system PemK/MazF family toxin [Nocardia alni]
MVRLIRGGVYRIDLGDAKRGHEQNGRRLGVLISPSDSVLSVATFVPTSTQAGTAINRPRVEIDGRETVLLVDQVRTIDLDYVAGFLEMLDRNDMAALNHALGRYLGIC